MSIEEVIDNAVTLNRTLEIEYCTRSRSIFSCEIENYSPYYGGQYIRLSEWIWVRKEHSR